MDCARTLLSFVAPDVTPSDGLIEEVVRSTEFKRMKQEITQNPQSFHLNPKVYFRSGTTNDWEQHLSPLAVAAIDAKTKELWGEDCTCPPLVGVRALKACST